MPRRSERANKGVPPKALEDFSCTMADNSPTSVDENESDHESESELNITTKPSKISEFAELRKEFQNLCLRFDSSEKERSRLEQLLSTAACSNAAAIENSTADCSNAAAVNNNYTVARSNVVTATSISTAAYSNIATASFNATSASINPASVTSHFHNVNTNYNACQSLYSSPPQVSTHLFYPAAANSSAAINNLNNVAINTANTASIGPNFATANAFANSHYFTAANSPYLSNANPDNFAVNSHAFASTAASNVAPCSVIAYMSPYAPTNTQFALPSTPASAHGNTSLPSSMQYYPPVRKLQDLPNFDGKPEQWPMFFVAFKETTAAHSYTDLENLSRLQKALQGVARQQVEALLIHPSSVGAIIRTLEFRFGRPDILIRSQIAKVRAFAVISYAKISEIVNFSIMVSNLTAFLENAGAAPHLSNPTLLDELVNKLPFNKKEEWVKHTVAIYPQYPTVRVFSDWLQQIATYISMATVSMPPPLQVPTNTKKEKNFNTIFTVAPESSLAVSRLECVVCKKEHALYQCSKFKEAILAQRWSIVKNNRLCFCCLRSGHNVVKCPYRRECGIRSCQKCHNRLLHEHSQSSSPPDFKINSVSTKNIEPPSAVPAKEFAEGKNVTISTILEEEENKKTLFKYLPVVLKGPKGSCTIIAFIDDGAKISLLEESVANAIGVKGASDLLSLRWIGNRTTSEISQHVDFEISGLYPNAPALHMKNVRTTKKLFLPSQTLNLNEFKINNMELKNICIHDYSNAVPQLLIGVPHTNLVRPLEVENFDEGFAAHRTKLGWTLFGSNEENVSDATVHHIDLNNNSFEELQKQVAEFYTTESFGTKAVNPVVSIEDENAKIILKETTRRVEGQYETGLLWKNTSVQFQESYTMALKRLEIVENKMRKDAEFEKWYKNKIAEYVSKSYARKLPLEEANKIDNHTWYLPHFAVCNLNKGGKLRLVFDAAAQSNGMSLNSMLTKGPDDYQPKPLTMILFNFRQAQVGVCGNIREMFHRINIRSEDRNAQRFLWRDGDSSQPPDIYVMRAMIFGSASSPCSAQYIKNLNATQYSDAYPRAVKAITDFHYVDDYVDSFDTSEEAIAVTKAVVSIHQSAGFELRGFVSNSPALIDAFHTSSKQSTVTNMCRDESTSEKILGMHWDSEKDEFFFDLKFLRVPAAVLEGSRNPTKSEVLSLTMSIFDPFGFVANVIIKSKLVLQKLWIANVGWSEPIPDDVYRVWYSWYKELYKLKDLRIPRCYNINFTNSFANVELHIFVDASEVAFSAVCYWRIRYQDNIDIAFVTGKSRCSPIKILSVPRLELQAAVLGVRLKNAVIDSHKIKLSNVTFWSDSKTVIHWIKSDSRRYKQFVGHRIAEILDSSESYQWKWVPGTLNPADDATRPCAVIENVTTSRWISGPQFLKLPPEEWPKLPKDLKESDVEIEKRAKFILKIDADNRISIFQIERYSNYNKLLKIVCCVIRAVDKFKCLIRRNIKPKSTKSICEKMLHSAQEIKSAEILICRLVQEATFFEEIKLLSSGLPIAKNSSIYKLTPVYDDDKLIRLGGRIDHASYVPLNTRRPIILPKQHALTNLIIRHYHELFHHQNQEAIICATRSKFWIPDVRRLVRTAKAKCQLCKNLCAAPNPPLMGQLPIDRLSPYVRIFSYTGVDFLGPIYVAIGRRKEKRWVAIFTCLTVRAIHLELAHDLSSDAAILCLRKFINRRGVPVRLRSDRGTNFVGAAKENWIVVERGLEEECARHKIEWFFNAPANPEAGGAWERMVRCVKSVLKFTLKERTPQIHVLESLLIEAENLVNSRPLTHLPIDNVEAEPLTPNHFIMGCPNYVQTPAVDENVCLRKQWHILQQMKQIFWKRWVLEYLPTLTRRAKWHQKVEAMKVGDVVIICDDNESTGEWKRGRIIQVFAAPDGQVRSAIVKTAIGTLTRPASKLAVLDLAGEPST